MTGARTLEVVHGLSDDLKVVRDGAKLHFDRHQRLTRLVRTDGKTSTNGIQQALGMFNLLGTHNPPITDDAC